MTKEEYQTIVEDIWKDLSSFNLINYQVTTIGEIFALKILGGLSLVEDSISKREVIREAKENIKPQMLSQSDDSELDIYTPSFKPDIEYKAVLLFFSGLRYAVNNWDDINTVLSNLGVKNTLELIDQIQDITKLTSQEESHEKILLLFNHLIHSYGSSMGVFFFWGFWDCQRTTLINFCKKYSIKEGLATLQMVKLIGEKYPSVYIERFTYYYYLWQEFFLNPNKIGDYLKEMGLYEVFNEYISNIEKNDNTLFSSGNEFAFNIRQKTYIVDMLFIIYHFIFKKPQKLIDLGFNMMTNKFSVEIQKAMFISFAENSSPLLQYIYDCWYSGFSTDEKPSPLPHPFSTEKPNNEIIEFVNHELDFSVQEKSTNNISRSEVLEKLKYWLKHLPEDKNNEDIIQEKGYFFKNNYFNYVCNVVSTLPDRYSIYGFACILYYSKYFEWGDAKFNKKFVCNIVKIFQIDNDLFEGKLYNFRKSKEKVISMLKEKRYKNLKSLLSENGVSVLNKLEKDVKLKKLAGTSK